MTRKRSQAEIAAIRLKKLKKEVNNTNNEPFTVKKTKGLTNQQLINLQRGAGVQG